MNLINFIKVFATLTLLGSTIVVIVTGLMETTPWLQFGIAAGIAAISFAVIDNIDGMELVILNISENDD